MPVVRRFFLLIVTLLSALSALAQETDDANRLFDAHQEAIYQVRIIEKSSGNKAALGSSFQISADGLLVSNYHVVADAVRKPEGYLIEYLASDGSRGNLRLLAVDVLHDLALLQHERRDAPWLSLRNNRIPKGTRIFSLGNPHDLGMTVVEGTYNGLVDHSLYEHVLISGSLNPGMSGGPSLDREGRVLQEADRVVLANAAEAGALLARGVPGAVLPKLAAVQRLAGQVSLFRVPPGVPGADVPRCILSGKGYCLPPRMGWGLAGSTYRPDVAESVADAAGHRDIRTQLAGWLPDGAVPWLDAAAPEGWAGWRAATADHLPIIGAVPGAPGLWLACAYGSRGLSWSALAGEMLGAELDAEPAPIERELARRVRPR